MDPTPNRIVNYRLTRNDAQEINRRRQGGVNNAFAHRVNANGTQVHVGSSVRAGDVFPLLIVRVWSDENKIDTALCRDYIPEEEPVFDFPLSSFGINGQVFLDGNDTLWVTSAPQGDFNGGWNWPKYG